MKYKELYVISYLLYAVSFLIPAYVSQSMSLCCGGTEIWLGWKCAVAVVALIFMADNALFALLFSIPNFYMITLPFFHKHIGPALLLFMLSANILSCSYWWIKAISDANIGSLLPGYWLWLLSVIGNNAVLLLNKRKRT
jgi:hypothetical protein